ncbi:hypothetical protein [Leptolyngbya ohadii]|uniref:hypothetical protein n=1 Tax=Leptolyngbya ohadii TaxID=1962290 RepID=UPI000B5986C0|nr:hypothetical protein [Leptolyngbya ohadii]
MLQDPENFEEWELEVWAENLATAQAKCGFIAQRVGLTEVINVSQETKNPSRNGTFRFVCWFKSESQGNDDDNSDD